MNSFQPSGRRCLEKTIWSTPWIWAALCVPLAAYPPNKESSQAVIYLEVPAGFSKDIELVLEKTVLYGTKDTAVFKTSELILNAKGCSGKQRLLYEQTIPVGHYDSLGFFFNRIAADIHGIKMNPAPPEKGLERKIDLDAASGAAEPIFLEWDPNQDVFDGKTYVPAILVKDEPRLAATSLAFVSNTGSNYLTCIDRFRQRVVNVVAVGQKPKDMAFASFRQKLYVANSGSNDISVIDIHSCRLERSVTLRGGDDPGRMALANDQKRLYVLNTGSNSLSVIDLLAYQEERRIHLEVAPASLIVDDRNNVVYVTSRDSDRLFAMDPFSFSVVTAIQFGANLDELAINRNARKLYVVKLAQRQISVLDIPKNSIESSLKLCGPASGMAFQTLSGTLFAAIPDCNLITILKPSENLEIGAINLPYAPGKIMLDPESKQLFITFPAVGRIGLYHANSWDNRGIMEVGKSPYTMIFAQ